MAEPSQAPFTPIDAHGAHFLVVEARFYDAISTLLLDGARQVFSAAGATADVVTVPGALEIPIAMALALDRHAQAGQTYDGAVALGCIIRGETYHFEIVANESARALTQLAVARRLPFGNGILAVENEYQALARAEQKHGDKGGAAARAALTLWRLKKDELPKKETA